MSEEQYSQQESTIEDTKMDRHLAYNISQQLCQPMGLTSTDTATCYVHTTYNFVTFLLFAITIWAGEIASLLSLIQTIKFYQRTGL